MADTEHLSPRERHLVTLATLAAADRTDVLDAAVDAALRGGELRLAELLEAVLHVAVYAGWPRASHLEMVVGDRWSRLHAGEPPAPVLSGPADGTHTGPDRRRAGEEMFAAVNGFSAPPCDTPYRQAVVEWVFGDLWCRPGLGRRDRRLLSIACAALCDAPFALATHVSSALNSGDLGRADLDEVVVLVAAHAPEPRGRALVDAVVAALDRGGPSG